MIEIQYADGFPARLCEYLEILIDSCNWISFLFLIGYLVLLAVWFNSAFKAAGIAEAANHPIASHFFMGLLMPYAYPARLAKVIEKIEIQTAEEDRLAQEKNPAADALTNRLKGIQLKKEQLRAERRGEEIPQALDVEEVEEEPYDALEVEKEIRFNRTFFESLPVDADGIRRGPFEATTKDGTVYGIDSVSNIQDELAAFVVSSTGKRIRLKYENIAVFASKGGDN